MKPIFVPTPVRTVTTLAFGLLLSTGCASLKKGVELATPPNDLPELLLPDSVRSSLEQPAVAHAQPTVPTTQAAMMTTDHPTTTATAPNNHAVVSATPQPNAYALVIGIEDYRDVPPVPGAEQDAARIVEVLRTTLGVPESNIVHASGKRASRSDIIKQIRWLQANVPAGGRVYFYFSGHGAPETSSGASYVLPWDGDPRFLDDTALPLSEVIAMLEQTKAKEVLAFADSCFSGAGGRSVLPPGARPLVRMKAPDTPKARVALYSAASGAEISGPVPGGQGGLFSSYVAEGLGSGRADLDGDGQITLQELVDWVGPRVSRDAKRDNRDQNPSLLVGKKLGSPRDFVIGWGYPPQ
jgi:uncharacterized caspase-like protein